MLNKIKIMGAYWDIVPVDNDNPLEHEHSGSCHFKKGKIYIDIDWPKKYVIRTIVHEVIHVLDYDLKLGLDEPTIVRLSTGLIESGIIDEELFLPILNRKEEK